MKEKVILVVEDEGLIALHLIEILENAGYQIIGPVPSGELVIKMLETSLVPDLIIMDIGLAGSLDGVETARRIRSHISVPLIFLTAYTTERTLERMREVKPDGYIVKPFIVEDLLALVGNVMKQWGP